MVELSKPVIGPETSEKVALPKSKKYDLLTFGMLNQLSGSSYADTIKKASIDSIVISASAQVSKEHPGGFTKQDYLEYMEKTGLRTFLGNATNSYFSYLSRHKWKGKEFIKKTGEDKYTVPPEVLTTPVKIIKPKAVTGLSFIGSAKVKATVHGAASPSQALIQKGLSHNDAALLYASAVQIAGQIYASNPSSDIKSQLDGLIKKKVDDSLLQDLILLQSQVIPVEKPDKYLLPKEWVLTSFGNTKEMYDVVKEVSGEDLGKYKLEAIQDQVSLADTPGFYEVTPKWFSTFNLDYAGVGATGGGGLINVAHQKLINLQKHQATNVKLSQRVIITNANMEKNKRIQAFIKQWKLNGAERLIAQTTGTVNAGVVFSSPRGNAIDGQIQVGEVNAHSIVLHDDGKAVHLTYHDASATRAKFLFSVFEAAGFSADFDGSHNVTAVAKSRPRVYALLANIIPNTVDLDLGSAAYNTSETRKAVIQAILKGYPVTGDIRDDTLSIQDPAKLLKIFRTVSKTLRSPNYSQSNYNLKIAELTGKKKQVQQQIKVQAQLDKDLKDKFKPGTLVYSIAGGHSGESGVVQYIEKGMVYVMFKGADKEGHPPLYDKDPKKLSLTPPAGKVVKPPGLKEETSDIATSTVTEKLLHPLPVVGQIWSAKSNPNQKYEVEEVKGTKVVLKILGVPAASTSQISIFSLYNLMNYEGKEGPPSEYFKPKPETITLTKKETFKYDFDNPSSIKLPYLGKDKFGELLKHDITYDWDNKTFQIKTQEGINYLNSLGFHVQTVHKEIGTPTDKEKVLKLIGEMPGIISSSLADHVGLPDYIVDVITDDLIKEGKVYTTPAGGYYKNPYNSLTSEPINTTKSIDEVKKALEEL